MKFVKILASLLLVFVACSAFSLKGKNQSNGMYIVGVSASFTDSLIYFTDVQFVDSVVVGKDKLLPLRGQYSDQMDNYLEHNLGLTNRTCFIYFDEKKQKLEKVVKKMKEKYQKEGKVVLKETGADFKFIKAVEY